MTEAQFKNECADGLLAKGLDDLALRAVLVESTVSRAAKEYIYRRNVLVDVIKDMLTEDA
ncbi:MAG: hypothetical protein WA154_13005 [Moraxellaceae bacterium]